MSIIFLSHHSYNSLTAQLLLERAHRECYALQDCERVLYVQIEHILRFLAEYQELLVGVVGVSDYAVFYAGLDGSASHVQHVGVEFRDPFGSFAFVFFQP